MRVSARSGLRLSSADVHIWIGTVEKELWEATQPSEALETALEAAGAVLERECHVARALTGQCLQRPPRLPGDDADCVQMDIDPESSLHRTIMSVVECLARELRKQPVMFQERFAVTVTHSPTAVLSTVAELGPVLARP